MKNRDYFNLSKSKLLLKSDSNYVLQSDSNYFEFKSLNDFVEWLEKECLKPITLSNDEIIILKNLDNKYNWISRSKNGNLIVSEYEPTKENYYWFNIGFTTDLPYNKLFKFIKWEDKDPFSINELLNQKGRLRKGEK